MLRSGVAHDVRRFVPRNARFWSSYARGTHQNWPIFDGRKLQGRPGIYLCRVKLTAIPAREFTLVVTVADTAGSRSQRRISVDLSSS